MEQKQVSVEGKELSLKPREMSVRLPCWLPCLQPLRGGHFAPFRGGTVRDMLDYYGFGNLRVAHGYTMVMIALDPAATYVFSCEGEEVRLAGTRMMDYLEARFFGVRGCYWAVAQLHVADLRVGFVRGEAKPHYAQRLRREKDVEVRFLAKSRRKSHLLAISGTIPHDLVELLDKHPVLDIVQGTEPHSPERDFNKVF